MENETTNRAKMSNKRCIKACARLQYLQRGYNWSLWSDITSHLFCVTWAVFLADLLHSPFRFFVQIIKFTFPQLMLITVQVLREIWFENDGFCSFTNNTQTSSGQDRKIPPALGTNQIAGFGGFRPLASLEKNRYIYFYARVFSFLLVQ